jgi:hypothetical protein
MLICYSEYCAGIKKDEWHCERNMAEEEKNYKMILKDFDSKENQCSFI